MKEKEIINNFEKVFNVKIEIDSGRNIKVTPKRDKEKIIKLLAPFLELNKKYKEVVEENTKNYEKIYNLSELLSLGGRNISELELIDTIINLGMMILEVDNLVIKYKNKFYSNKNNKIIENIIGNIIESNSKDEYIHKNIERKSIVVYNARDELILGIEFEKALDSNTVEKKLKGIRILSEVIKTIYNIRNYKSNIENIYISILKKVSSILEYRNYIYGNFYDIDKLLLLLEFMAKKLEMNFTEIETLKLSAILKDVGTILITENILHKRTSLTNEEKKIIEKHTYYSYNILKNIPYFEEHALIIKNHHERYDGNGYPKGINGKEIPISANLLNLVSTFLALVSSRVYRKAYSNIEAKEIIKNESGKRFYPELVEIFIENYDEIIEILS
ncbi:HD-GYP domain-containing protein [Haliovirga abyssi]|uniref:HD-GYP domain-containing protein n=1 Tax=Haliovirga abyssi TaxID=2996794 RepID=A0AAU9DF19_9FUSO|nr:HD domain-containing phosphohydrolase [Haliovirga abyssi]BDU50783.1 hypothetical protein HLVA_13520 [Haliovirga abyssi]